MARLVRDAKGRWTKPQRRGVVDIAGEVAASRRMTIVAAVLLTAVGTLAIAPKPGAPAAEAMRAPCAAPAAIRPQRPPAPSQWPAGVTCYYGYRKGPC